MKRNAFKAIILAGGSGERFWPLSTAKKPKQFLRVFGDESLIRQSVTRLSGVARFEDVFVVTSKTLVAATRRELPELPAGNIIGEPMRRDTGAAVALGVGIAGGEDDDVLGFFPADQLVAKPAAFRRSLKQAIALAERKPTIVTLGIKPTSNATVYGYVDPRKGTFVEKPDEKTAARYVKAGYLWNAGMFIARRGVFKAAFAEHAPQLEVLLEPRRNCRALASVYEKLPRISFDYAVMEKMGGAGVVAGDFGWDDVGGYAAFDRHFKADSDGNVFLGEVKAVDSGKCVAVANGPAISLLGVKDLVIVSTRDSVLVLSKEKAAEMKKLFTK